MPIQPITDKSLTVISSYNHAVYFTRKPLIIGERINPTGKSKFKQALRDHDMEYIYKEGLTQEEKGAQILDVNVGLPEIDEPALMKKQLPVFRLLLICPCRLIPPMEKPWKEHFAAIMVNQCSIQ